jgi:hypothetical protein
VKNGRVASVRGAADHPVNFGHLGPKGEDGWVANKQYEASWHDANDPLQALTRWLRTSNLDGNTRLGTA